MGQIVEGTNDIIVDYDEFALRLMELGYDIKYKTFDELIGHELLQDCPELSELTTINLEPQKNLTNRKMS